MTIYAIRDFLHGAVSATRKNHDLLILHGRLFCKQTGQVGSIFFGSCIVQFDVSVGISLDQIIDL